MRRPLSRLLAFSGLGGAVGAFLVGGPVGVLGGVLLGAFGEEVWGRVSDGDRAQLGTGNALPAHGDFGADAVATGLRPGERLLAGQSIPSPSGRFLLALTGDGELVLYDQRTQAHVWSSETPGSGARQAFMTPGGNLVLLAPDGTTIWSSGTSGDPGARLTVHDDGNLVVYSPMGIPAWQSHTAQSA